MVDRALIAGLEQEVLTILETYREVLRRSKKGGLKFKPQTTLSISTNEVYCKMAIQVYEKALLEIQGMKEYFINK